ncbi:MAG: Fic family protein [Cyanobacteria bacterium HKST-UBA04]|nr:Fic family protein [Cyanobacteria bacterium HKST-UBA04]
MRSGQFVKQTEGYEAFIPSPLPPHPPIDLLDPELNRLLSDADRALGRLDGAASIVPNPDLFVTMFIRHEAVLSSQIEGTQSTLGDLLEHEAGVKKESHPYDVNELVNYVAAMNHGLDRLGDLPLSLRLLREIHHVLMSGVRGGEKLPGEFRRDQNYIGAKDEGIGHAIFVPPPVPQMLVALDQFEKFMHQRHDLPVLIHCGLLHAQFETIHPFLDGNGRVGRLLITLMLCEQHILQKPLLYLSYYLKANRTEYYDRLMRIRTQGDWEGWLKFFLRGMIEVSKEATQRARDIVAMREAHRERISDHLGHKTRNGLLLLELLFHRPLVTVSMVEAHLACSYNTANKLVIELEALGLLNEITGAKRNRAYLYNTYYQIFQRPLVDDPAPRPTPSESPALQ